MGKLILGQSDLTYFFAKAFKKEKVSYLLTGSLAVSYYGLPRATHDIDFIIEIIDTDIDKLLKAIKQVDSSFLISREEIKRAINHHSQFNLFHSETGIKIDFWVKKNAEFEKSKFKRAKRVSFDGQEIKVISPEDLILNKLLWIKEIKSEKHLTDCAGILKIQGEKIDVEYLKIWAKKLGVEELLEEIISLSYTSA